MNAHACVAEGKMAAKTAWLPEGNAAQVARERERRLGRAKNMCCAKTIHGARCRLPSPMCRRKEEKNILKDKPPRGKYIQNGAPVRVELRRQN